MRYGIIAGNGRFPILALEAARIQGDEVIAIGIEGEASKEIEALASKTYWISITALTKLVGILQQEQITEILFCGQVKHVSIFSALRPDWRLAKLLLSLKRKNTDSLLGGVIKIPTGSLERGTILRPGTRDRRQVDRSPRRFHRWDRSI